MESWDNIYKANAPKLIGICRRYVKDTQLAEDLVQEAFIVAIDKSNTYSGKGTFEGWLRRIVINTALQHIRKNKNVVFTKPDVLEYQAEEMQDVHDSEDIPESERDAIERGDFSQQELLETIDELPEHHKAVFNLYVIDEYTHKEIGDMLGISPGTSKSHLARARKKLQQMLVEKSKKKKDRKGFFWFLFGAKADPIDKLYKDSFKSFEIQPKNIPSFKDGAQLVNTKESFSILKTFIGNKTLLVSSLGLVTVGVIYFLYPKDDVPIQKQEINVVKPMPEKIEEPATATTVQDTVVAPVQQQVTIQPKEKAVQAQTASPKKTVVAPKEIPKTEAPQEPVVIRKTIIKRDTVVKKVPVADEK